MQVAISVVRRALGDDGELHSCLGKGARHRFPRATEPLHVEAVGGRDARHCVTHYEHALPFARIYANSATRRSTADFTSLPMTMITERLRNLSQVRAMRAAFA